MRDIADHLSLHESTTRRRVEHAEQQERNQEGRGTKRGEELRGANIETHMRVFPSISLAPSLSPHILLKIKAGIERG
jgi:hypothetical protein